MILYSFPRSPEQSLNQLKNSDITGLMSDIFDMLFEYIEKYVDFLRSFKFFGDVSYFDFFIALIVLGVVITYLINVARNPGVETISTTRARERRREADARREDYEVYKRKAYSQSLRNHEIAYREYLSGKK